VQHLQKHERGEPDQQHNEAASPQGRGAPSLTPERLQPPAPVQAQTQQKRAYHRSSSESPGRLANTQRLETVKLNSSPTMPPTHTAISGSNQPNAWPPR
jgi:hypothetical protein